MNSEHEIVQDVSKNERIPRRLFTLLLVFDHWNRWVEQ